METLFPSIKSLGCRVAIIGRSSSGKSTLAQLLGKKLIIPVYHLDQLACIPGTDWQFRKTELVKLEHDKLIKSDVWIIEGNYQKIGMEARLARATFVIWLDMSFWRSIFNFYRRFFRRKSVNADYAGRLQGANEHFTWRIFYYARNYTRKRCQYLEYLKNIPEERKLVLRKFSDVKKLMAQWQGEHY